MGLTAAAGISHLCTDLWTIWKDWETFYCSNCSGNLGRVCSDSSLGSHSHDCSPTVYCCWCPWCWDGQVCFHPKFNCFINSSTTMHRNVTTYCYERLGMRLRPIWGPTCWNRRRILFWTFGRCRGCSTWRSWTPSSTASALTTLGGSLLPCHFSAPSILLLGLWTSLATSWRSRGSLTAAKSRSFLLWSPTAAPNLASTAGTS